MITVTASAHCLRCDWSVSGEWAATDRAAERHTRTAKHPTGVMAVPATTTGGKRP